MAMNRLFEEEKWNYYIIIIPIILFFVSFIFWASTSEIDEVVRGEGKVIPSGQTKILQHLEGGIVSDILVKEGDNVQKGDIIYKLKNAFFKADFIEKEYELLSLRVKALRIQAELAGEEKVDFEDKMMERIPDIIDNELKILKSNSNANKEKINIAKNQVLQKELKLQELEVKFDNLSIELRLAMENMAILEKLLKKRVVSKKEYLKELSKKQNIVTKIEEVRNSIPIVKEEIEETKRKIETVKEEIKSKLLREYSIIKVEINKLNEKTKANKDRDLREAVISPVNGIVNKLYFYTIGGIVKPGDKIAEITPIEDSLMIEARIKTSDRALIWSGQNVSIEITAYDFSKYGLLKGKVLSISPDSFIDRQGNNFYIVKIKSDNFEFAPDLPILPGMVANVNILTGKKTIMQYLIKPLKDISRNSLTEQ